MSLLYSFRRLFRRTDRSKHPFDHRHRVDTSGLLYPDQLATGSPADEHTEGYYATAPSLFHGMIAVWRRHLAHPLSSYTFVDLGCGKGRVVLLASTYAFRSITGIELNPRLAGTARRNAERWLRTQRACNRIAVFEGDATELSSFLPTSHLETSGSGAERFTADSDRPLALFLFNAFGSQAVERLMRNLSAAARQRASPIDLLYLHPDQHQVVMATPGVHLLADEEVPLSTEDAEADAFQVATDRCAVYRLMFT